MEQHSAPIKDQDGGKKPRKLEPRMKEDMISQREIELIPPVPISARKCTDCLFLIIFLLYCIGMLVIGIIGFQNGDPQRLVYGSDYKGRTCGEGNYSTMPYLIYPRPHEDVYLAGSQVALNTPWEISFFSVCSSECPKADTIICDDEGTGLVQQAMAATNNSFEYEAGQCIDLPVPLPGCYNSSIRRHCWTMLFDTTPILFRCFPQYIFEIELLPETGCTKKAYQVNSITNETIESCVRVRSKPPHLELFKTKLT